MNQRRRALLHVMNRSIMNLRLMDQLDIVGRTRCVWTAWSGGPLASPTHHTHLYFVLAAKWRGCLELISFPFSRAALNFELRR